MKQILFVLLLAVSTLYAQPKENLQSFFEAIRQGQKPEPLLSQGSQKSEEAWLKAIIPFTEDSVVLVREAAYDLLLRTAQESVHAPVRQKAVVAVLDAWYDTDTQIISFVASALKSFPPSSFNVTALNKLMSLIRKMPPYYAQLVKLAAYVQVTEAIPLLQNHLYAQQVKSKSDQWAIYLALCRLGDEKALDVVMNRVQKVGVNDDVVYEVFPDLVYTRQRRALDYIIEQIHSDDKNCQSPNPEREAMIPCAYRIMEQLVPAIQGYPLKTDASGDVLTEDYPAALRTVRSWLLARGQTYQINTDIY